MVLLPENPDIKNLILSSRNHSRSKLCQLPYFWQQPAAKVLYCLESGYPWSCPQQPSPQWPLPAPEPTVLGRRMLLPWSGEKPWTEDRRCELEHTDSPLRASVSTSGNKEITTPDLPALGDSSVSSHKMWVLNECRREKWRRWPWCHFTCEWLAFLRRLPVVRVLRSEDLNTVWLIFFISTPQLWDVNTYIKHIGYSINSYNHNLLM